MVSSSKHGSGVLSFFSRAAAIPVNLVSVEEFTTRSAGRGPARAGAAAAPPESFVPTVTELSAASPFMAQRFASGESRLVFAAAPTRPAARNAGARGAPAPGPHPGMPNVTLATCTVIVEGARTSDLQAAKNRGARVLHEGFDGKVLLQCDSVEQAFGIANLLHERQVGSATPNFVRYIRPTAPSPQGTLGWAHRTLRVPEAWQITQGSADVKIAVLDEGVDVGHPALSAAVVAQKDFIGSNGNSASPSGNDAHGTCCAGIIVSRDANRPGIAKKCSLIAARIGMGDGHDGWVFDDYATADAIDWSWREGAAVISNSWGGGVASDAISRAFGRARTQGRGGLGSVVVIAAGNAQAPIDFPGNLPGYITVGASNPSDELKTRTSSDSENWWGSNFGPTMWLLAPGVFISTTDISGPAGYKPGDFTDEFNGTSSATPHVAAAAALILSIAPTLSASEVREILRATAVQLPGQTTFTEELGWGRLDVAAAVARAASATPLALGNAAPPAATRATKKKKLKVKVKLEPKTKLKPKAKLKPKVKPARK